VRTHVILNLVPAFLDVLQARDPLDAYRAYQHRHRAILAPYWHNHVLDLDAPQAGEIARAALAADRRDLHRLMASVDLERAAAEGLDRAAAALGLDQDVDVVLMVGVGAANACELVVEGRGAVVVCVEHFTGSANPETFGLGLPPTLLPMWIAHELAHLVRYCSPGSRAALRRFVAEAGGRYDCWDLASRASLRELLVNEGLAVHAARAAAPGLADEAYFGFTRSLFRRLRELEAFLVAAAEPDLDRHGLGLRLRWLTGGMAPAARLVHGRVLPERAGYYLGARMTETLVLERGIAEALRSAAPEFAEADARSGGLGQAASA
jgi:hypothetical protein